MDRNLATRIWYNDVDIKPWTRTIFWIVATSIFAVFMALIVGLIFAYGFWANTNLDKTDDFPLVQPPELDLAGDFLVASFVVQSFDLLSSRFSFQINIVDISGFSLGNNTLKRGFTIITPGFEKVSTGRRDFVAGKDSVPIIIQDTLFFQEGDIDQYPFDKYKGIIAIRAVDSSPPHASIPIRATFRGSVPGFRFYNPSNTDTGHNFQQRNPAYVERHHTINELKKQKGIIRTDDEEDYKSGVVYEFAAMRSTFVKSWSLFVVLLMWVLSVAQLGITLQFSLRGRDFQPVLMAFSASFLFSLPAFRNIQPNIPPIGVASDALGFYYNMFFIVVAIVINISVYLKTWAPKPLNYEQVRVPV